LHNTPFFVDVDLVLHNVEGILNNNRADDWMSCEESVRNSVCKVAGWSVGGELESIIDRLIELTRLESCINVLMLCKIQTLTFYFLFYFILFLFYFFGK